MKLIKEYPEVEKILSNLRSDPFEVLIYTLLSQNTTSNNTVKAFENLENNIGCKPHNLCKAPLKKIEDAIRIAGMYRVRSRKIKAIAKIVKENYGGSLRFLEDLPIEEARRILIEMPGVGYKTADIVLLFCFSKPVFPIDTHIFRISRRIGIASQREDYERLRAKLETIIKPENYRAVHLSLIQHGRRVCKPRRPRCGICLFRNICSYFISSRR